MRPARSARRRSKCGLHEGGPDVTTAKGTGTWLVSARLRARAKVAQARRKPSMAKGRGGWQEQPKGKGKGMDACKGGAEGQGKMAPLYESCWTCGGGHVASDCPSKGKGKGAQGLNVVDGDWHSDDARALSSLADVPDRTHNEGGWGILDHLQRKKKQGQSKQERKADKDKRQGGRKLLKPMGVGQIPKGQAGQLGIFQTIKAEGFDSVGSRLEWESIAMAVDGGAPRRS